MPGEQLPGGSRPEVPGNFVYLPETHYRPVELIRLAADAALQASISYDLKQKEKAPDARVPIGGAVWAIVQYAVLESVSLNDDELWDRAVAYDHNVLNEEDGPQDQLGIEERQKIGNLLDQTQDALDFFSVHPETSGQADKLSMMELRKLVAVRTFRLAYLSRLDSEAFANRGNDRTLDAAAIQTSLLAEKLWRQRSAPLPEADIPNQ